MHETEPCTHMFSNGMEFEWFIEHNCERCKRYRKGQCKVYNACWEARFDESRFPYEYLLDFADGVGGKQCKLFTDVPIKRKKQDRPLEGQQKLF